jgi:glucose-1-phosphate thymidylyltransferase
MKGVILCGGSGTRLKPLTNIINKHLLPVYNQPMIYYPIRTLVNSGIKDIMLVCGGNNAGDFLRIVGNGQEFGLKHVAYTYQKEAGGIAQALSLAEDWVNNEPVCVILGDNIIHLPISNYVEMFVNNPDYARIFLTEVDHPEWYGVVTLNDKGDVVKITEKPKNPKSNLIAVGLYMYNETVWKYIKSLTVSARKELEVTDLNNVFLKNHKLKAHKLDGFWGDAGESIDTYLNTCIKVREIFRDTERH